MLKSGEKFMESNLYREIKDCIKDYLAEAIGNVVSAGFKFLCKSDLEEGEAKEMASKNIMLNVFSIHKQVVRAIFGNKILLDKHGLMKENDMNDVREDLIV